MNLPFYIAKRYLFSKKSHNAINVISGVSVCGVALATLALVCTLSVFNGFQDLVATFFTAFDPELKITAASGKVFDGRDKRILKLRDFPEIEVFSESLEDNAMVQYNGKQAMVVIKGVEDNFSQLTAIDSILYGRGEMVLYDEIVDYAIPGVELTSILGTGIRFLDPLEVYAPKRGTQINVANPASSFNVSYLHSSGLVFAVNQQKYDASYIITSLKFARDLFQYDTEVSSVELKLKEGVDTDAFADKIGGVLGSDFIVQNRYEQQADTFRIMQVEKLISYVFLTFILLVACFNVIGSLSMLIIEKKNDVVTLRGLGADDRLISRIFLFEGCLISFLGALVGVVLGLTLCLVQQEFGVLTLGSGASVGAFVVDAYPVSVHWQDIVLILVTVLIIGFLSVLYPVKFFSQRLLDRN
ncbi:MAG: ABC transporter permease [Bacteroidaceae bacterium]|nr:ABC transporter permease [Bacteroidaceae bacterium]